MTKIGGFYVRKYRQKNKPNFSDLAGNNSANGMGLYDVFQNGGGFLSSWYVNMENAKKTRDLEDTIIELRKELQETKTSEKISSEIANRLLLTLSKLYLLTRVNEDARKMILESDEFSKQFSENSNCAVFVISIDIRRSTELMLRARAAQQFADFMTKLCSGFKSIIEENFGVFDKFTGDGVLAFFPEFFSGKDAGFYTISAADRCHKLFEKTYKESRSSFVSIIADTGLGIGIDYGPILAYEVQLNDKEYKPLVPDWVKNAGGKSGL